MATAGALRKATGLAVVGSWHGSDSARAQIPARGGGISVQARPIRRHSTRLLCPVPCLRAASASSAFLVSSQHARPEAHSLVVSPHGGAARLASDSEARTPRGPRSPRLLTRTCSLRLPPRSPSVASPPLHPACRRRFLPRRARSGECPGLPVCGVFLREGFWMWCRRLLVDSVPNSPTPSLRMVSNWLVIWDFYKVFVGFSIGFRLRTLPLNFGCA